MRGASEPAAGAAPPALPVHLEWLGGLGAGGMGEVMLARDRRTGDEVAVKTLRSFGALELYLLKQEFRALAGLTHRGLVSLRELVEHRGEWFLVMERIRGATLGVALRGPATRHDADEGGAAGSGSERAGSEGGGARVDGGATTEVADAGMTAPFEVDLLGPGDLSGEGGVPGGVEVRSPSARVIGRLRRWLPKLCATLGFVHGHGRIHRDLKPSNIMVDEDDRVVVLDFGLVVGFASEGSAPASPGGPGALTGGTLAYMAPEQRRRAAVGPAADRYALGAILHEALIGALVAPGERERRPDPREWVAGVPDDLAEVTVGLLAAEPERRIALAEVFEALGCAPGGETATGFGSDAGPAPGGESGGVGAVRAELVDELTRLAGEAQAGRAAVALVRGPAGVGKSTVCRQVLGRLGGEGIVLEARCHKDELIPYRAFDAIVDRLAALLVEWPPSERAMVLGADGEALAGVFPVLGRVVARGSERPSRSGAARALRRVLGRLGARRPVTLFIDDVQWGDQDSAELLRELAEPLPQGVFVLATWRTGDAEEVGEGPLARVVAGLVEGLAATGRGRVVELGPLSREAALTLARGLARGTGEERERLAERVVDEAHGMPLYIEQLCRWFDVSVGGPETRAAALVEGEREGRASLAALIAARVAGLPEEARAALEVVAVSGVPLPLGLVRAVSGASWRAVAVLRNTSLVRTAGLDDADRVECYHDQVRAAMVGGSRGGAGDGAGAGTAIMGVERQRRLHGMLGRAYAGMDAPVAERAYVHLSAAGEVSLALPWGERAAAAAEQALAFDQAAGLLGSLCEAIGESTPAYAGLRERLARAQARAGRGRDAAKTMLEVATLVGDRNGERALEMRLWAGQQLLHGGELDAGLEVLDTVLAGVGVWRPRGRLGAIGSLVMSRARVWGSEALRGVPARAGLGALEGRIGAGGEGRARGRARGRGEVGQGALEAYFALGTGLGLVDPVRAFDFTSRYLLAARAAGDEDHLARATALEATQRAASSAEAMGEAEELLARAERWARGKIAAEGTVGATRAVVAFQQGHWRETARVAAETAERVRRAKVETAWLLDTATSYELFALGYLGELAALAERGREALDDAVERGDLYGEMLFRVAQPVPLALVRGEVERVPVEAAQILARWSPSGYHFTHFWALRARIVASLAMGRGAAAWGFFAADEGRLERSLYGRLPLMAAEIDDLRGRAAVGAAREADPRERERLGRVAMAAARRLSRHRLEWARALGMHLRGLAMAVMGSRVEAGHTLLAAGRLAGYCEMELWRRAARWRAGLCLDDAGLVEESVAWVVGELARVRDERVTQHDAEIVLRAFAPG